MDYDLVLCNGHVIDPSQGINHVLDVGIREGVVAELGKDLPATQRSLEKDLRGKYVCPGLIDLHGHWYEGSSFGVDPNICLNHGVTTVVDAGTTGFINFPEFRKNCIDKSRIQTLAFIHIGCLGLPTTIVGELEDLRFARPNETARVIEHNRDVVLGVKIRQGAMTGAHGLEALEKALAAAKETGLPMMVHISKGASTPEILRKLRPGDIVTHCFQGRGDGIFIEQQEHLLPEVIEARKKGVFFDVGHGSGSFSWETARKAFELSVFP